MRAADAEGTVEPTAIGTSVLLAVDRRRERWQGQTDHRDGKENEKKGGPRLHRPFIARREPRLA
jgi:hypothetical protein